MHELGIVYEVVKVVDGFVSGNGLTQVDKIVLQIGQLSQAIPRFVEGCFPAAVSGTMYEKTELEIVVMPAMGACRRCSAVYNVVERRKVCPECQSEDYRLISGREFEIKEIVAR